MAVDPSIILGVRAPQFDNLIDQQAKAQQVQQIGYQNQIQQRQMADDQATRSAYQQATTAGADGMPTLDRQKFTQSLAQQNPMLAYQKSQDFATQDAAKAKAQLEITKNQHEQAANLLSSIPRGPGVDPAAQQAAWEKANAQAMQLGFPGAANAPKQYPGDSYIQNAISQTMDAKEQLTYQQKAQENQLKHEENQIKRDQLGADKENKMAQDLDKHLSQGWAGRSGQAGQVQAKINAAQAAEALIEQGKTQPGGLDSRQIEELAQSGARMLGGGAQASARVDALVPHTLMGRAQTAAEWATNSPRGADQQAFVDRLAETVAREKGLAEQQMRQFQVEGLAAHQGLRNRNPNLYNSILQSKGITPDMIDANGRYKAPGATPFHQMSDDELDKAYRAAGGK